MGLYSWQPVPELQASHKALSSLVVEKLDFPTTHLLFNMQLIIEFTMKLLRKAQATGISSVISNGVQVRKFSACGLVYRFKIANQAVVFLPLAGGGEMPPGGRRHGVLWSSGGCLKPLEGHETVL